MTSLYEEDRLHPGTRAVNIIPILYYFHISQTCFNISLSPRVIISINVHILLPYTLLYTMKILPTTSNPPPQQQILTVDLINQNIYYRLPIQWITISHFILREFKRDLYRERYSRIIKNRVCVNHRYLFGDTFCNSIIHTVRCK